MPTKKESDIYDLFEARYRAVYRDYFDRRNEYIYNYRQMLGQDLDVQKPWGARVNSQHTHAQVMTYCAFMQAGLIPTYPWFYVEMNEPWRELEPRAVEEYNRRLRNAGYYRMQFLWLRLAASMKLGVCKLTFGDTGPVFNLVHPGNIMWDPTAHNLRYDAEWVIEEIRRKPKSMMKAEWKAGNYTCSKSDFDKVMQESGEERTMREEIRAQRMVSYEQAMENDDEAVTLFEMVTAEKIYTIHEGSRVVLREIDNPYGRIFYYDLTTFPEAFEVEGYGIPDLMRDLQDEINTLRRQRIDVRSLIANPMFQLLRSSNLDPFTVVSGPGSVFPTNTPQDLTTIPIQDNSMALQSEEGILTSDADRLIGVQGQTRGEAGRAGMKATVANIIHSNVNVRFSVAINMIQDYPLRPLMQDYVELSTLWETPVAITQPEWELVRQRAEEGSLWLVPHSEAYIGNAVEKFQLLANVLQTLAPITAPPGIAALAKEMLALIQMRDPERVTQHIMGNMEPDPVLAAQQQAAPGVPGAMQGAEGVGRGIPMTEEMARAQAPMQAGRPMPPETPV